MLERIPINSIFPGPEHRLRRIRGEKVQALVQSIREIGLQSPISLRAVPCKEGVPTPHCHNGNTYHLVAGEHRLQACKALGWKHIPAFLVDLGDAECRLWEIDENLVRAELNELERAEHLRERKFWYEKLHPETRNGGDHGNQHTGGGKRQNDNLSFCQDTAEKTGLDRRTVERSVRRAEAIAPAVKKVIADMPAIADKSVELDALAALKPDQQEAAVEAVRTGKARSVRDAAKHTSPAPKTGTRRPRSEEDVLRRGVETAVKQYHKRAARRLAALQVRCTQGAVKVDITYADDGAQDQASQG